MRKSLMVSHLFTIFAIDMMREEPEERQNDVTNQNY